MDTVQEEISPPPSPCNHRDCQQSFLHPPQIVIPGESQTSQRRDSYEQDSGSALSSRRPSAIIAALRRPSQAVALSAAQAVMNQRRYLLGLFNGESEGSIGKKGERDSKEFEQRVLNKKLGDDSLTVIISALYAKLLVVLGMAFPITEVISKEVQAFFYQGFYLYLYLGSILFVGYMYLALVREKSSKETSETNCRNRNDDHKKANDHPPKFGSFYLRLGAIAFGIGSMVYSGLEFGRYFELKNNPDCDSNVLQAVTPATRMVLTLVQVQFIFLNTKDIHFNRHNIIARFGLMHMIATNLCEWLCVLVEETKHEIIHLAEQHHSNSSISSKYCKEGDVMGSLVTNASPFLFPCTIEYSLICAVILFEMWKKVKNGDLDLPEKERNKNKRYQCPNGGHGSEKSSTHFQFNPFGGRVLNSNHHFSVDCSNAHRGLFAGIMVIVLTIISLIMFFVLSKAEEKDGDQMKIAKFEVNMVELFLYIITTIAVAAAMWQMRQLKYDRKKNHEGSLGIGLDNTLLLVAQTGMFVYCMFSIIGCYFTIETAGSVGLAVEIFSFVQTCLQTMFVLDGWRRRCRSMDQTKRKPGRELITFLIVANMAMWTINTLEKNRAGFRPAHLKFFGEWAWTIITHISMPLAIFYRFHSTICLFEIWKSAYKIKSQMKSQLFPLL